MSSRTCREGRTSMRSQVPSANHLDIVVTIFGYGPSRLRLLLQQKSRMKGSEDLQSSCQLFFPCFLARLALQPEKITYIHFSFRNSFPEDCRFQLHNFFRINFPQITLHVFVCDSENDMDKLSWNYFRGKSHFSYIEECFPN